LHGARPHNSGIADNNCRSTRRYISASISACLPRHIEISITGGGSNLGHLISNLVYRQNDGHVNMEAKNILIPELAINNGVANIDFFINAFDAIELWTIRNEDGSVHVAAFSIKGNEFRIHEERPTGQILCPQNALCTTVKITLSVDNVSDAMTKAIAMGATEISPVTDYEYGYRQGELKDPFGHRWVLEKLLNEQTLNDFVKSASDY
jgi:PhnB protein